MTGVTWDYTPYAATYGDRPGYASAAVEWLLATSATGPGARCCDLGAGTGHLTVPLLDRGLLVDAVEPNEAMRGIGVERTRNRSCVRWISATAESTGLPTAQYQLVTFGSSFNVVDKALALAETARLLVAGRWMACLWNHRELSDPLQAKIEAMIASRVPGYAYGDRREDQTGPIERSGLFVRPLRFEATQTHHVPADRWVDAWRSHATLGRQAGDAFDGIIEEIRRLVARRATGDLAVPYRTRVWLAQVL